MLQDYYLWGGYGFVQYDVHWELKCPGFPGDAYVLWSFSFTCMRVSQAQSPVILLKGSMCVLEVLPPKSL